MRATSLANHEAERGKIPPMGGLPAYRKRVPPAFFPMLVALVCITTIHYLSPFMQAGSKPRVSAEAAFGPTVPNTQRPHGPAPRGMVWIPGGEFSMGAQDPPQMDRVGMQATLDSRPIHRVYVDGFFIDKTDVTNTQFVEFVKATGYITIAEKTPTPEEFPGAPPENLYAGGVVFSPPSHAVALNDHFQRR
jgi:formylglycine-generating enzyme required for sulfatase activity